MRIETEVAWRRGLVYWHARWWRPGIVPKLFVAWWLLCIGAVVLLLHGG